MCVFFSFSLWGEPSNLLNLLAKYMSSGDLHWVVTINVKSTSNTSETYENMCNLKFNSYNVVLRAWFYLSLIWVEIVILSGYVSFMHISVWCAKFLVNEITYMFVFKISITYFAWVICSLHVLGLYLYLAYLILIVKNSKQLEVVLVVLDISRIQLWCLMKPCCLKCLSSLISILCVSIYLFP